MIDEEDLRRLLADAAGSIPPPGRGPEALLAGLTEQPASPARRRPPRLKLVAAAATAVAVVALGATLANDDDSTQFSYSGQAVGSGDEDATDGSSGTPSGSKDLAPTSTTTPPLGSAAGDGANPLVPEGAVDRGSNALEPSPTPGAGSPPGPPADSAKIIKTGSLDLEVREGAFDGTVDRITAQTIGLGGYIAESTTSESGDSPSGSIVVRVPENSFEPLLADLRELGEVKAVSSKGTDVTAQFTDLAARLTALTATRDRLATVLSEAENVPDILAVQDRITAVQVEIEQIQGQQRLLADQTSFATLAVTLGEPGAEIIKVDSEPDEGLGEAWDDARRRFGDAIENIVAWSGSAAVVLIIGLLLLALSRVAWIGLRRRMV